MQKWQQFFDAYADRYDAEVFTQNTAAEVQFILDRLRPAAGDRLLDVGCGTGRHSVPLAAHGIQVTGVDVSPSMLRIAAERAAAAGVAVEWVNANAVDFVRPNTFDVAICLCEGALCLLGADDDPLAHDETVLRNLFRSLKPRGRCLFNVLNACRHIRMFSDEDVAAGRFDVLNLTERSSDVAALLPTDPADVQLRERSYTPPELRRLLAWIGFEVVGIYGGTAGAWHLGAPKLDEYELMALAGRPAVSDQQVQ